jgi:hypothetical protein
LFRLSYIPQKREKISNIVISEIHLLSSPDFLPAPVNDPVVPVKGKLVAKPAPKKRKTTGFGFSYSDGGFTAKNT